MPLPYEFCKEIRQKNPISRLDYATFVPKNPTIVPRSLTY